MKQVLALGLWASGALAQEAPLSAIDWLSQPPAQETALPLPPLPQSSVRDVPPGVRAPLAGETEVAGAIHVPQVTSSVLMRPTATAVGLLEPAPQEQALWSGAAPAAIRRDLEALPRAPLPAVEKLVERLLLLAVPGPTGSEILSVRVARLMDTGHVPEAFALLEAAVPLPPALAETYLEAALLSGQETRACTRLMRSEEIALPWLAQSYCLALKGDWEGAVTVMSAAEALGEISAAESDLLGHFLDPDLFEHKPPARVPLTPLSFRMYEAVGAPRSARGPAYDHYRLSPHSGWKARAEAAERLARMGAISPERLDDIMGAGRPSASGSVWERVSAVQGVERAIAEEARLAEALETFDAEFGQDPLTAAYATLWADDLTLDHPVADRLRLLAGAPQGQSLAAQIARGGEITSAAQTPHEQALVTAFSVAAEDLPAPTGALGAHLLQAVRLIEDGRAGAPAALRDGMVMLRAADPERARQAAVEYLLLDHS